MDDETFLVNLILNHIINLELQKKLKNFVLKEYKINEMKKKKKKILSTWQSGDEGNELAPRFLNDPRFYPPQLPKNKVPFNYFSSKCV